MTNGKNRIVAMLLSLIMIFTLSACVVDVDFARKGWDGYVDGEQVWENPNYAEDPEPVEEPEEETTEPEEEVTEEEDATAESGEKVTKAKGDNKSKTATSNKTQPNTSSQQAAPQTNGNATSQAQQSQSAAKPQANNATQSGPTQAEILELYKTAANKVKTTSGVTATRTREVYTEVGEKNISGIGGSIINMAFGPKDDNKAKTVSGQSNLIKGFVVENQNYVCALTESDIKSATLNQSGSNKIITIYVKDDTTNNQNYSNKAVSATAVADLAATFQGGLVMKCRDVRITATLDQNDRLINLNTYMPSYFTKDDQKFGAAIEQWWTISYS